MIITIPMGLWDYYQQAMGLDQEATIGVKEQNRGGKKVSGRSIDQRNSLIGVEIIPMNLLFYPIKALYLYILTMLLSCR